MSDKTRTKVRKMLEAGEIDAEMGIDAIKAAIKAQIGISEAGEAAADFATNTISGLVATAKAVPKQLFADVADRVSEMGSLRDLLKEIVLLFDMSPEGREKLAKFVDAMIRGLKSVVTLVAEFARGFGGEFMELVESMDFGPVTDSAKELARSAGAGLARFFIGLLKAAKAFFSIIGDLGPAVKTFFKGFAKGLGIDKMFEGMADASGKMDWEAIGRSAGELGEKLGVIVRGIAQLIAAVGLFVAWMFDLDDAWKRFSATFDEAVFGAISRAMDGIANVLYEIQARVVEFVDSAYIMGRDIVLGIANGIKDAAGHAVDAARDMASDTANKVKEFFKIGSPSKVMEGYGFNVGEGLARGITGSDRMVTGAMGSLSANAMPGEIDPSRVAAAARRSRVSLQANVEIHINGSGGSGSDNADMREQVRRGVQEALAEFADTELMGAVS